MDAILAQYCILQTLKLKKLEALPSWAISKDCENSIPLVLSSARNGFHSWPPSIPVSEWRIPLCETKPFQKVETAAIWYPSTPWVHQSILKCEFHIYFNVAFSPRGLLSWNHCVVFLRFYCFSERIIRTFFKFTEFVPGKTWVPSLLITESKSAFNVMRFLASQRLPKLGDQYGALRNKRWEEIGAHGRGFSQRHFKKFRLFSGMSGFWTIAFYLALFARAWPGAVEWLKIWRAILDWIANDWFYIVAVVEIRVWTQSKYCHRCWFCSTRAIGIRWWGFLKRYNWMFYRVRLTKECFSVMQ